ncbi:MAG: c-type cytochrome biogenesis protein CcmF, partial [Betaproteobacteria bacterium]
MIPELGQLALILALLLAFAQAFLPLAGVALGKPAWAATARPVAIGQFLFVFLAWAALAASFLNHDFSVANVAQHSNLRLPAHYRLAASWGSHEGSMLLWALMLGGWTAAVALLSRHLPERIAARVIGIMGLISIGFLLFIITTSNPFERLLPPAEDGRDLNPLLQDPGMVMHPPLLYMGYVGFAVAFAFALAALV